MQSTEYFNAMQLLCCKELGFSWRVESDSKLSKAHSWLHNAYQFSVAPFATISRNLEVEFEMPSLGGLVEC